MELIKKMNIDYTNCELNKIKSLSKIHRLLAVRW